MTMRLSSSSATISAVGAMAGWGGMGFRKRQKGGCYFRRNRRWARGFSARVRSGDLGFDLDMEPDLVADERQAVAQAEVGTAQAARGVGTADLLAAGQVEAALEAADFQAQRFDDAEHDQRPFDGHQLVLLEDEALAAEQQVGEVAHVEPVGAAQHLVTCVKAGGQRSGVDPDVDLAA